MNITMEQPDLEAAIRDYINKMGITRPVGAISFTQRRGENAGITTEIEITDPSQAKLVGTADVVSTAKAPAVSLKKVADDPILAETTSEDDVEQEPTAEPEKVEPTKAASGVSLFNTPAKA
jgi:hypothetical protein